MAGFFRTTLEKHARIPTAEIVGNLSLRYSEKHQDQKKDLTRSWESTVPLIKNLHVEGQQLINDLGDWTVIYEYSIPRRNKRVDVILLSPRVVFVVECKIGAYDYFQADQRQLENYCYDLRDFHKESEDRVIIPILLCTNAPTKGAYFDFVAEKGVTRTQYANQTSLIAIIEEANRHFRFIMSDLDSMSWDNSAYMPTPTIIEAARSIYATKTSSSIARNQAGIDNLESTQASILEAIRYAQANNSKSICFITGVPGAGKTLAGLNIVHNRDFRSEDKDLGTFLSGNSPLVKVLSEALAIDFSNREGIPRVEARRQVSTFITNVHTFIDEHYEDSTKLPPERVLIYDEAQRAWTAEHKTRKSYGKITASEPEILMSTMGRFTGWAVIVCLVGGGQEINTGEAGLREWGRAIETNFSDWKVYVSPNLKEGDHTTGHRTLFEAAPKTVDVAEDSRLHLTVGIRSPRASGVSEWVSALLDLDIDRATRLFVDELARYPVVLTRDLRKAKSWLRQNESDETRIGLIASSGGRRLRAVAPDPYHGLRGDSTQQELGAWYLNPREDVRSSNFLEIVSTEYAIQGLEIDWSAVLWDADLRFVNDEWQVRSFVGTIWQNTVDQQKRQYTLNKYRVLLTRARDGMVIFVPEGDIEDKTRQPEFYDGTFEYLKRIGIPILD